MTISRCLSLAIVICGLLAAGSGVAGDGGQRPPPVSQCDVTLEDRDAPPWFGEGTGKTEKGARDAAVHAACDPAPAPERALCRSRAANGIWQSPQPRSGGGAAFHAEVVITRPKTTIKAVGLGPTDDAACRAAIVKACRLIRRRSVADPDTGQPVCAGTSWYIATESYGGGVSQASDSATFDD